MWRPYKTDTTGAKDLSFIARYPLLGGGGYYYPHPYYKMGQKLVSIIQNSRESSVEGV